MDRRCGLPVWEPHFLLKPAPSKSAEREDSAGSFVLHKLRAAVLYTLPLERQTSSFTYEITKFRQGSSERLSVTIALRNTAGSNTARTRSLAQMSVPSPTISHINLRLDAH